MTPPMSSNHPTTHWSLDRRVPVGIIAAIVLQSLALGWWASSLDSRVTTLEMYMTETKQLATGDRLVRLETRIEDMLRTVQNIDRKLDSRGAHRPNP